jgi:hypothetical protein
MKKAEQCIAVNRVLFVQANVIAVAAQSSKNKGKIYKI